MIKHPAILPACVIHTEVSNLFARKLMSQPHIVYGSRRIDSMRLHAPSGGIIDLDFDTHETDVRILFATSGTLPEIVKDISLCELETELEPFELMLAAPHGTHELLPVAHTTGIAGTCEDGNRPLQAHLLRLHNKPYPVLLQLLSETTAEDDDHTDIITSEYLLSTVLKNDQGDMVTLKYQYRMKRTGMHYMTGECMTYLRSHDFNMNWCAGHLDFEENTPDVPALTHIYDLGPDRETDIAITLALALFHTSPTRPDDLWHRSVTTK